MAGLIAVSDEELDGAVIARCPRDAGGADAVEDGEVEQLVGAIVAVSGVVGCDFEAVLGATGEVDAKTAVRRGRVLADGDVRSEAGRVVGDKTPSLPL